MRRGSDKTLVVDRVEEGEGMRDGNIKQFLLKMFYYCERLFDLSVSLLIQLRTSFVSFPNGF